jgi:FkbM family methyltransferase
MGTARDIRIGDVTVTLDLDSAEETPNTRNHELWRASTYQTKEPDTMEWIRTHVRDGVLYDVGANIGQYSLYAAKLRGAGLTVLAFEPEALNHAKLVRNIVLNGLSGTVLPYCLAVSGSTGLDRFYTRTFAPGAALHAFGRPVTQGEVAFEPRSVQGMLSVSLDDLTGRFGAPFPTHIKIDVDGIEEEIVSGAERTLGDSRLRSVLVEVYLYRGAAERIRARFERAGFRLASGAIPATEGIVRNLIFLR